MPLKSNLPKTASDPLTTIALTLTAIILLGSVVGWYFLTDHSIRATTALLSAGALTVAIALMGLSSIRSLIGNRRK